MFNNTPRISNESLSRLIECSINAVKGYEDYLLDRITYNDLAKIMKKLHAALPEPEPPTPKAKRIDPKDYKNYFE